MMLFLLVMYDYCQWHYGLFQVLALTLFLKVMYDW